MADKKEKIEDIKPVHRNEQSIAGYAEKAYLEYAMSVVKGRAIPSVEDGLKPVHRRILYAMYREGMVFSSIHKKSARVVGNVLGLYHPHGDQSVYEALVRQAQNFSVRYPLIDGQGNFGSRDGDMAASMRYCFVGSTRVMTEYGLLAIKDIANEFNGKICSKEVEEIDMLGASINGPNKISKWLNSGIQEVLEVETEKGYKIQCTENEPLYVLNKNMEYQWSDLYELKANDYVTINRKSGVTVIGGKKLLNNDLSFSKDYPLNMSVDFARFLGYLLSDGWIREDDNSFGFGSSDKGVYDDYKRLLSTLFPSKVVMERVFESGKRSVSSFVSTKPHYEAVIKSKEICRCFRKIGLNKGKSLNKKIPECIYKASKEEVSEFLKGFCEGDGSISIFKTHNQIAVFSISLEMLEGIKQLLLNFFGIVSNRIHKDDHADIGKYQVYRLFITDSEDVEIFKKEIGFISKKKSDTLNSFSTIDGCSVSFSRKHIPHLSQYIDSYFSNLAISSKYIKSEDGLLILKKDVFSNFSFSKFKKIKTFFKLKHYLSLWNETTKSSFPSLYKKLNKIIEDNYFYDKIVKITKLNKFETVYDLTVENTHAFVANGFIAHNTESKLSAISQLYLDEIKDNCVTFHPNYDGEEIEPQFLPAKIPFILLNGNPGIGVGMATDIPCHNIKEVVHATIAMLENSKIDLDGIMQYIKGPDFPCRGQIISSPQEIKKVYAEGRGSIRVRSKYKVEPNGKNWKLVFYEIPQGVSGKLVMEEVDALFNPEDKIKKDVKGKDKKVSPEQLRLKNLFIGMIGRYTDSSDKDNPIRLVFEPKNMKQDPEELAQILLGATSLETNISCNFVVVGRDGRPTQKNLVEILSEWIDFRVETVDRRVRYHIQKISERLHILEGRRIILNNIDAVIQIIKTSEKPKEDLMAAFGLSEIQAQDVLELRLRQLGRLEIESIDKEMKELTKKKLELEKIISSEKNLKKQIIKEMNEDVIKFGDDRYTEIIESKFADMSKLQEKSSKISEEPISLAISTKGWVKVFKGNKTKQDVAFKEGDYVQDLFHCKNTDILCIFDVEGKVFNYPLNELSKDGQPLNTLIQTANKISIACPISKDFKYLISHNNGSGFITSGENLMTRLKVGKEMFKVGDGNTILQPLFFKSDEVIESKFLGIITTENKFLTYSLSEISEINKGKGIIICGLSDGIAIKEMKILSNNSVKFDVKNKKGEVSEYSFVGEEFNKYIKGRATKGSFITLKAKDKNAEIQFKIDIEQPII